MKVYVGLFTDREANVAKAAGVNAPKQAFFSPLGEVKPKPVLEEGETEAEAEVRVAESGVEDIGAERKEGPLGEDTTLGRPPREGQNPPSQADSNPIGEPSLQPAGTATAAQQPTEKPVQRADAAGTGPVVQQGQASKGKWKGVSGTAPAGQQETPAQEFQSWKGEDAAREDAAREDAAREVRESGEREALDRKNEEERNRAEGRTWESSFTQRPLPATGRTIATTDIAVPVTDDAFSDARSVERVIGIMMPSFPTLSRRIASSGVEVDGNGYARAEMEDGNWGLADGFKANTEEIRFGPVLSDWGNIVAFIVFDSPQGGRPLWAGSLADTFKAPLRMATGGTIVFAPGELRRMG